MYPDHDTNESLSKEKKIICLLGLQSKMRFDPKKARKTRTPVFFKEGGRWVIKKEKKADILLLDKKTLEKKSGGT